MARTPIALVSALTIAIALAGCGGGEGGSSPIVTPTTAPTVTPVNNGRSTATITSQIPADPDTAPTSTGRNGPFLNPGTHISGPSGAWYVNGTFSYGQPFNVKCNVLGTATLGMTNSQQGPTNPLSGFGHVYLNNTGANYPASGALPVGSKKPGDPYHGGLNPNPIYHLATVNCDANGHITLN